MSQSNFLPPLPPPQPCYNSCSTLPASKNNSGAVIQFHNDECSWASEFPEIRKSCFLSRVCQHTLPKNCKYSAIPSILQVGPTCGLTALSMLLNGQPTPEELLAEAIDKEYTINGEMFSAQHLFELTKKYLNSEAEDCILHKHVLNCPKIKEHISAGGFLLVPYDADVNHAPCKKSGHRAHWTLIVGYLIDDTNEFYVLARHGKTRNLAIWSLSALSESNANLEEFAQPKGHEDCTFLVPPGGIGGPQGLKERSILFKLLAAQHKIVQVR